MRDVELRISARMDLKVAKVGVLAVGFDGSDVGAWDLDPCGHGKE